MRRSTLLVTLGGVTALLAVFGVGFAIVTYTTAGRTALDDGWLALAEAARNSVTLSIAYALNVAGGTIGSVVLTLLVALGFVLAKRWQAALFVVASCLTCFVVAQVVKKMFGRARPEDMLVVSDFGSFPSGHAAQAAALSLAIAIIFARWWVSVLAVLYTLAMMFSRTLLAVHWLTDVLAGALIGVAVTLLAWLAFRGLLAASTTRTGPAERAEAGSSTDSLVFVSAPRRGRRRRSGSRSVR